MRPLQLPSAAKRRHDVPEERAVSRRGEADVREGVVVLDVAATAKASRAVGLGAGVEA